MLSNTSKYAIRAVIYLAIHAPNKEKIGIKKISEALDIPSPFLGKILQVLVRKKILSSTKGPHGGFGSGKNIWKITLYDIIVEMEGADLFESCLLGTGLCKEDHHDGYCAVHNEFAKARTEIIKLYKGLDIKSLAEKLDPEDKNLSL
jgi:Rrf2 family protein